MLYLRGMLIETGYVLCTPDVQVIGASAGSVLSPNHQPAVFVIGEALPYSNSWCARNHLPVSIVEACLECGFQ